LEMDAPSGAGPPPPPAPEGTTGDEASLLMVMGAEVVERPALSVATTWTWYAAGGSEPVTHQTSPEQVVPLQGTVAKMAPLPQYLRLTRAGEPEAEARISMLLPVHTPLVGNVMLTVGPLPPPVPLETVTLTLAVAVRPVESVTVRLR